MAFFVILDKLNAALDSDESELLDRMDTQSLDRLPSTMQSLILSPRPAREIRSFPHEVKHLRKRHPRIKAPII